MDADPDLDPQILKVSLQLVFLFLFPDVPAEELFLPEDQPPADVLQLLLFLLLLLLLLLL